MIAAIQYLYKDHVSNPKASDRSKYASDSRPLKAGIPAVQTLGILWNFLTTVRNEADWHDGKECKAIIKTKTAYLIPSKRFVQHLQDPYMTPYVFLSVDDTSITLT